MLKYCPNNAVKGENALYANRTAVEGKRGDGSTSASGEYLDFLSSGFKIRVSNSVKEINDTGNKYIFAAWAEMPQKYAVAR